jgi:hypothetical protein
MDSRIKKAKKLFFSFLLVSSCNISAFNLQEYSTFYNSGKNSAEESLKNVENNVWKMSSKIEHSIFQVTQEATFRIEDNKVFLLNAFRKTRAFGGFRKEKQSFVINYDKSEIAYEYNKEKGTIPFNCENYSDCRFFDNLTLQIQSKLSLTNKELPLDIKFNYLDKGKIKEKVFQIENSIDTDRGTDANKIKFSEIRDDDKGFTLWFDPLINYTTYKIYQDFGSQDLTWNLQSKLLEE